MVSSAHTHLGKMLLHSTTQTSCYLHNLVAYCVRVVLCQSILVHMSHAYLPRTYVPLCYYLFSSSSDWLLFCISLHTTDHTISSPPPSHNLDGISAVGRPSVFVGQEWFHLHCRAREARLSHGNLHASPNNVQQRRGWDPLHLA